MLIVPCFDGKYFDWIVNSKTPILSEEVKEEVLRRITDLGFNPDNAAYYDYQNNRFFPKKSSRVVKVHQEPLRRQQARVTNSILNRPNVSSEYRDILAAAASSSSQQRQSKPPRPSNMSNSTLSQQFNQRKLPFSNNVLSPQMTSSTTVWPITLISNSSDEDLQNTKPETNEALSKEDQVIFEEIRMTESILPFEDGFHDSAEVENTNSTTEPTIETTLMQDSGNSINSKSEEILEIPATETIVALPKEASQVTRAPQPKPIIYQTGNQVFTTGILVY